MPKPRYSSAHASMKTTEQLAAMEMMAVDPLARHRARLLAGILAMPLLAAIFSAVGVYGGYFVGRIIGRGC